MILILKENAFVTADETAISPADRGFTLGDGLFETIRVQDGAPRRLDRHMARLTASARALALPVSFAAEAVARAIAAHAPAGLAAARLTLSRGVGRRGLDADPHGAPTVTLGLSPYAPPEGPLGLTVSDVRRAAGSVSARHKTLSCIDNAEARRRARADGFDEALMLNQAGEIACAAAANIFWIAGGVLRTPALSCGALGGVTRACVLRQADRLGIKTAPGRYRPADLCAADAAFLTNALMGGRMIARLDGARFETQERLAAALIEAEARA